MRKYEEEGSLKDPDQQIHVQKGDIVILEYFDHSYKNEEANKNKLDILEDLVTFDPAQIVVCFAVHPTLVIEYYKQQIKTCTDTQKISTYKDFISQWSEVFSTFIQFHIPINFNKPEVSNKLKQFSKGHITKVNGHYSTEEKEKIGELCAILTSEIQVGEFLPGLSDIMIQYVEKFYRTIDEDDLLMRIKFLSDGYYFSILNTLSNEEKHIVYDLAKDGFINTRNYRSIRNLLERGIIVFPKDHKIRLFNKSFTQFILTNLNSEELQKLEEEVEEKGTWNSISTVLIIILIGIAGFVIFGNPNLSDSLSAILGVLAGLLGILPRLMPLFKLTSGNSNAN